MKTQVEVGWAFIDKCIAHRLLKELTYTDAAMAQLKETKDADKA